MVNFAIPYGPIEMSLFLYYFATGVDPKMEGSIYEYDYIVNSQNVIDPSKKPRLIESNVDHIEFLNKPDSFNN